MDGAVAFLMKTLIVLLGPTGVGKTDLSIELAQHFRTSVISCDSRQIYKEMRIGTAVPTARQLATVPHFFIQTISVQDYYNSWQFEVEALAKIRELFEHREVVLMSGGSMLYIDAVCKGIDDIPTIAPELRDELTGIYERGGLDVIRNSSLRTNTPKERGFRIIRIGLNREKEELYDRINCRVDQMLQDGLMEEARGLYPYRDCNALNTVGYKEWFDFFDGKIDEAEAIRLIKRNSRRYARKQLSWFRRDGEICWFHPGEKEQILSYLRSCME